MHTDVSASLERARAVVREQRAASVPRADAHSRALALLRREVSAAAGGQPIADVLDGSAAAWTIGAVCVSGAGDAGEFLAASWQAVRRDLDRLPPAAVTAALEHVHTASDTAAGRADMTVSLLRCLTEKRRGAPNAQRLHCGRVAQAARAVTRALRLSPDAWTLSELKTAAAVLVDAACLPRHWESHSWFPADLAAVFICASAAHLPCEAVAPLCERLDESGAAVLLDAEAAARVADAVARVGGGVQLLPVVFRMVEKVARSRVSIRTLSYAVGAVAEVVAAEVKLPRPVARQLEALRRAVLRELQHAVGGMRRGEEPGFGAREVAALLAGFAKALLPRDALAAEVAEFVSAGQPLSVHSGAQVARSLCHAADGQHRALADAALAAVVGGCGNPTDADLPALATGLSAAVQLRHPSAGKLLAASLRDGRQYSCAAAQAVLTALAALRKLPRPSAFDRLVEAAAVGPDGTVSAAARVSSALAGQGADVVESHARAVSRVVREVESHCRSFSARQAGTVAVALCNLNRLPPDGAAAEPLASAVAKEARSIPPKKLVQTVWAFSSSAARDEGAVAGLCDAAVDALSADSTRLLQHTPAVVAHALAALASLSAARRHENFFTAAAAAVAKACGRASIGDGSVRDWIYSGETDPSWPLAGRWTARQATSALWALLVQPVPGSFAYNALLALVPAREYTPTGVTRVLWALAAARGTPTPDGAEHTRAAVKRLSEWVGSKGFGSADFRTTEACMLLRSFAILQGSVPSAHAAVATQLGALATLRPCPVPAESAAQACWAIGDLREYPGNPGAADVLLQLGLGAASRPDKGGAADAVAAALQATAELRSGSTAAPLWAAASGALLEGKAMQGLSSRSAAALLWAAARLRSPPAPRRLVRAVFKHASALPQSSTTSVDRKLVSWASEQLELA